MKKKEHAHFPTTLYAKSSKALDVSWYSRRTIPEWHTTHSKNLLK